MNVRVFSLLALTISVLFGQLCMMPSADALDVHAGMEHETHPFSDQTASTDCDHCFVHAGLVDPTPSTSPDRAPIVAAVVLPPTLPIIPVEPPPAPTSGAPPGRATNVDTIVLRC